MTSQTARCVQSLHRIFKPPPSLTLSQWADDKWVLSSEASAEPGGWRTSRAEYQRGMMDAVTDSGIEVVVFMVASQTGKTEALLNAIGYHIDQDPAPILVIQPTLEMAEAFSKDRIAPMLRDTPCLRGKVEDPRSRDSNNTVKHKAFAGGHLSIAGANSASGLASRPIRILLADEIDRYPLSAGAEGDPVSLGIKRTSTFWNRKIVLVSSPTVKNISRIERAYNESDMRQYHVPCGACNEYQVLRWKQVRWNKPDGSDAHYVCEHCGVLWNDAERWAYVNLQKESNKHQIKLKI